MDENGVWNAVFDAATDSLRVTITSDGSAETEATDGNGVMSRSLSGSTLRMVVA